MTDPGAIIGGFHFFGWLFPARPLSELTDASYEELCEKYKWWDFWGNWIGFSAFVALAGIYAAVLVAAAELTTAGVPREYYVGPAPVLLIFIGIFLSLFSSGFVLFNAVRLLLERDEYNIYMAYGGEKLRRSGIRVGFDAPKVFALFFWLIAIPLLLVAVAYIDNYTSFTPDKIIHNPFWSLGRCAERPYSDVAGVYVVQKAHLRFEDKALPYQVIRFVDGTRWQTERSQDGVFHAQRRKLVEFVAKQSGKPVEIVEFDENIPQ